MQLMLDVVHSVSPTDLKIVHADYPDTHTGITTVFGTTPPMPSLEELRINGYVWATSLSDLFDTSATKRLCISGPYLCPPNLGYDEKREESLGEMVKRVCPKLTHLRFKPPMQSPSADEPHYNFVHKYCFVSRSAKEIMMSPLSLEVDDGAVIDQANRFVQAGDDIQHDIPARLHRVIVESPPFVFIPGGALGKPSRDDTSRAARLEILNAYRALALEAKRESGIGEDEDPGKRSLKILPSPPDLRRADRQRFALEEFTTLKKEWLERAEGTGPGCWV